MNKTGRSSSARRTSLAIIRETESWVSTALQVDMEGPQCGYWINGEKVCSSTYADAGLPSVYSSSNCGPFQSNKSFWWLVHFSHLCTPSHLTPLPSILVSLRIG